MFFNCSFNSGLARQESLKLCHTGSEELKFFFPLCGKKITVLGLLRKESGETTVSKYRWVKGVLDCWWGCRVCFGAWSHWQGGACRRTSVSELNNLCGISAEVGAGRRRSGGRATTSCRTQKESHLCYVMAARALHPSLSIPLLPFKTPPPTPCLSLACASLLWVGFGLWVTENGLDSVFAASFFVCLVTKTGCLKLYISRT